MFALSVIFAASFSVLVAAQALLDELRLPTSDPQCGICSPALANAFATKQATTECNTHFASDFFNCLICSSQTGSLSPPALGLPNIRGASDDFIQRCAKNGFSVQISIGGDGSVSVQTPGSSTPSGTTGASSNKSSDGNTSLTLDSKDSDPSSTSSSDPAATSAKKDGGERVVPGAGLLVSILLGMAFL
ncbi:hypothetical protein MVEN_02174900 [Mycena venus]|uniref:Uncharacterized protein n=1 Tax=Mycena venus TaxID=2733690 RepID=A0A8H7CHL3_9AGAR|nr:hypothetical protein MVEN_02174900 [Mycena venus]